MEAYIDLHVHSTASDGTFTPTQVVELAIQKRLKAFALTDHDTTAGIEEAFAASRTTSVEVIPGIELSTTWNNRDVHVVGLDLDYKRKAFQRRLQAFQDSRTERNDKIIYLLQKQGFPISREAMEATFPCSVWTRAHFGKFLMECHAVSSIEEAFMHYLGQQGTCYVPREKIDPFQAVDLIHLGGGIAVFAHPLLSHFPPQQLEDLAKSLKQHGLDGIEVFYSTYTPEDTRNVAELAQRCELKYAGGSDFHGSNKPDIQLGAGRGNLKIPYQLLEELRL